MDVLLYYFNTIILILNLTPNVKSDTLEYDGPSGVKLFHSLEETGDPKWTGCGAVTFQNVNLGSFTVTSPVLHAEAKLKLQNLARKDLLYRLKAVVTTLKGKELTYFTFIRACTLLDNGLVDTLTISLDHVGSVIGITLSASDICDDYSNYSMKISTINRTVVFRSIEQGPVPDTTSYIQKMEREREAKERGATQDNRSFFAKYWIYIVPAVLFFVLSGGTNVDGGGTNGGNR